MMLRSAASVGRQCLSLDKVIVTTVVVGTALVLWDARQEGNQALLGQYRANRDGNLRRSNQKLKNLVTPITFQPSQLDQLESDGYLVIDNFLTSKQVEQALKALPDEVFHTNPNIKSDGKNDKVRTDKAYFFRKKDNKPALEEVRQELFGVGHSLANSSFAGFERVDLDEKSDYSASIAYANGWLGMPRAMQVSLYQRNQAENEGGDYYRMHTDACNDSIWSLGMLGYLRSLYLRRRYVTCIVYLNPDWKEGDGGCLRLFLREDDTLDKNDSRSDEMTSSGGSYIDVEPMAGRLVIFSSRHIMHAVLPTFSRRLACSMWMTLNDD